MTEWTSVAIPKNFKDKVQQLIDDGVLMYSSVGDFVRSAMRDKLRELGHKV